MTKLIETIQLLLYKENPSIFEKINIEDESIFLEPLLFAYFNSKKDNSFSKDLLLEIVQGYFIEKETIKINESCNKDGIAYISKMGYYDKNGVMVNEIFYVENTNIEVIYHSVNLLNNIFRDINENPIEDNKIKISIEIFDKNKSALSKAMNLIKNNCYKHYQLIEKHCKKILLFKTEPENTNSFATINAHGIAFLNVYQEDYDEVFFIDDIAHQTGHIIMNALTFTKKDFFIIDENTELKLITKNKNEYRNFFILYHALYTYYTTFLCLDACLENNCFDYRQKHEAYGRIGFYLQKCNYDLSIFDKVVHHNEKIENVLINNGIEILNLIKIKYYEILKKHKPFVSNLKYNNQPYNFTYSKFSELNPLQNV
jgi:hypothetical protein